MHEHTEDGVVVQSNTDNDSLEEDLWNICVEDLDLATQFDSSGDFFHEASDGQVRSPSSPSIRQNTYRHFLKKCSECLPWIFAILHDQAGTCRSIDLSIVFSIPGCAFGLKLNGI